MYVGELSLCMYVEALCTLEKGRKHVGTCTLKSIDILQEKPFQTLPAQPKKSSAIIFQGKLGT
jgi:hypothetical protein